MERVNSDRFGWAPTPGRKDANWQRKELEATPQDHSERHQEGKFGLLKNVVDHLCLSAGDIQGKIEWEGYYDPIWDPPEAFPEELISSYLRQWRNTDRQRAAK